MQTFLTDLDEPLSSRRKRKMNRYGGMRLTVFALAVLILFLLVSYSKLFEAKSMGGSGAYGTETAMMFQVLTDIRDDVRHVKGRLNSLENLVVAAESAEPEKQDKATSAVTPLIEFPFPPTVDTDPPSPQVAQTEPPSPATKLRIPNQMPKIQALFYNRVAKCGSTNVMFYMKEVSKQMGFYLQHVSPRWEIDTFNTTITRTGANKDNWGNTFARYVREKLQNRHIWKTGKVIFAGHFKFVDFDKYRVINNFEWSYINVLRDPIARTVSDYNYRRWGVWRSPELKQQFIAEHGSLNIQACIQDDSCVEEIRQGLYLERAVICGDGNAEYGCHDSIEGLRKHIQRYYTVISVTDELSRLKFVLGCKLPEFFPKTSSEVTPFGFHANQGGRAPSENVVETFTYSQQRLLELLAVGDFEAYSIAKQQFQVQLNECKPSVAH